MRQPESLVVAEEVVAEAIDGIIARLKLEPELEFLVVRNYVVIARLVEPEEVR